MKINKILFIYLIPIFFFSKAIFSQETSVNPFKNTQKETLKENNLLYPGEQLLEINKVQTLFKFIKGDPTKPLIVFIPGDAQLARISYGFPNAKEDDFLSYWLQKKGYSFLGISYPTDNPVYSNIYPSFNIKDWGKQVAMLTKSMIEKNYLSNHVVVLGFGMGGSIEESVQESLEKVRVNLDCFLGLSATPPLPYVMPAGNLSANKILPNQLADRKVLLKLYLKLLTEQNKYNNHEIISEEIYQHQFIGNIPVALAAEGYHLNHHSFEYDIQKTLDDGGVFDFAHTPLIGLIYDDSSSVAKTVLVGPSSWNFIRNEMLYRQYIYYTNVETNMDKFLIAKRILTQIPQHFSETVHGNHFFFVGKKGARETAQKVELLMQRINSTKQNLQKLALDYGRSP